MRETGFTTYILVLFDVGFLLAISAGPGLADGLVKTFKSKNYGYAVRYPSTWYPGAKRSDDPLDIISFPPSEAIHALYIPRGGAEIIVAPVAAFHLRQTPGTVEAWIKMDTARKLVVSQRTFELRGAPDGMGPIREIRTEEDDPALETISWYFHFRGQLFKAMLLYWHGDPGAIKLSETMNEVVRSLTLSR